MSTENLTEIWTVKALNLNFNLGVIGIFARLSLPIHEHGMSVSLFRSFFLFLSSALCSFHHKNYVHIFLDLHLVFRFLSDYTWYYMFDFCVYC